MFRGQYAGITKQTHQYYLGGLCERYIVISSDFDSGNLGDVKQISDFSYRITSASDCAGTPHEGNTRSWFYFSVKGFPANTRGRFIVAKVNILWSFINNRMGLQYYPCYNASKEPEGWRKLEEPGNVYENRDGDVELQFDYLFKEEGEEVRFAITYPYEYERCQRWTADLQQLLTADEDIYFVRETLVKSPEGRNITLLTFSDRRSVGTLKDREDRLEGLFPENDQERALKEKKPVILISARVHPGETPSSYALEGLVKALTNKSDYRSHLLLRFFTFKIVPMLNPDGVEHGHYRMDTYGQNLNRYYNNCTPTKQPAIFGLKSLMEQYSKENRLLFYFDLHAHPARKGCFMYGNALSDFVGQVENYVFCKLMALNTRYFQYGCCNFSTKHMKHKDRFEELTKEGCGRVFAHRCSGMIHSFTLELGYHFTNNNDTVVPASNQQFAVGGASYKPILDCSGDSAYLTPKAYAEVGEALLVSVLDIFQKNPYSRVPQSDYCTLDNLRRLIAFEVFHEDERFRMYQAHTYTKVKHVNELIEESFFSKLPQKHFLMPAEVDWPACVRTGRQNIVVSLQRESASPTHHYRSASPKHSEKVQLPEIGARLYQKRLSIKIRDCSEKKEIEDRDEEVDMDSVESSEESDAAEHKTEGNEPASAGLPECKHVSSASPTSKLKMLNLKLNSMHPPSMFHINDAMLQAGNCCGFTGSNRQIKQVNLTFEQNFIVLPVVERSQSNKPLNQTTTAGSSKLLNLDFVRSDFVERKAPPEQAAKLTGSERPHPADEQLKEQLLRQMEYFKKEIKEQFSKDIKKEVTEQINRSSFVRGYIRNRRAHELNRNRRNKFFPCNEPEVLAVGPTKAEERSRLLRLPSIGK